MTLKRIYTFILINILVSIAAFDSGSVSGQTTTINWTVARNISNTPTSTNHPTMVADVAGNVHVVWSEDIGGESILGIPQQTNVLGNSLVYTRWDGSAWSTPTDIIALPGDDLAEYPALTVDNLGFLHLVWTGMSVIYYSRAPVAEADSSRAWLAPLVLGSSARTAWESALAVDQQNVVHILYANREDDPAVVYVRIENAEGESATSMLPSVSLPVRLSPSLQLPDEVAFLHLSLKIDPQGRMHALWEAARQEGFGQAIYYTRSLDGGQTWSEAMKLAQGKRGEANAEWPSLGIVGDSELHLIYCYPANMARQERISLDAGETWGEPHTIYPELEGISGFNVQVTDAVGNSHVLSGMRTHQQVGGLAYWRWLGDQWSPNQFASLETEHTGLGGHWHTATIRLGNEIHALWNTNFSDQAGEVWHVSGIIPDVPAATPVAFPAPENLVKVSPEPTHLPESLETQTSQMSPAVPALVAEPGTANMPTDNNSAEWPKLGYPILIGAIPALLLVIGVVIWHLLRKR